MNSVLRKPKNKGIDRVHSPDFEGDNDKSIEFNRKT